jgi:taurine dioxygenase
VSRKTTEAIMQQEIATHRGIVVSPSRGGVGAEVLGIDLRRLGDATFAAIEAAWVRHSVLLFRGQTLTDDDLVAFSGRFGSLDLAPIQETGRRSVAGLPEIYVVSNVVRDGAPIGSLGAGEAVWHTDMSYLPEPPKASLLYALEIPAEGGNTSFCNMYAALERLSAALRQRVAGLQVKHDGTYNSGGYLRQGVVASDDPRTAAGTLHPLICRHPDSGREMLYLGRRRNAWLAGLDLAESEALLDALWAGMDAPEIGYTHRWRVGDLVLWDNRCTMHRRDAFDPASRRVMHRTQVKGGAPPSAA